VLVSKERKRQAYALIPPALVLAIIGIHLLFFVAYIECKPWLTGCRRIEATSIYPTETAAAPRQGNQATTPAAPAAPAADPAGELKGVTARQAELSRKSEELQARLVEEAGKRTGLVNALNPAALEPDELKKSEKVIEALDAEKTEIDVTLTILDARRKGLEAELTSQKERREGSQNRDIERHNKRLTWVLLTGLFILACAAVFFTALYLPDRVHHGRAHPTRLILALVALFAGYGLIRWLVDSYADTVFEEIVGLLKSDDGYLPTLSSFFDIVGNTAAFALLVATALLLWHPSSFFRDDESQFDTKLAQLSERRNYLRLILYAGTIVMVVGIVRMRALLTWVQSFVTQAGLQVSVDEFSKIMISFQGVLYSLLLVAVYLSARQIITERARSLPIKSADAANRQAKLDAAGFGPAAESTYKDYLPKVAAILAPLFAGPLMDLVGKIFY
jgi:hypothetical protein